MKIAIAAVLAIAYIIVSVKTAMAVGAVIRWANGEDDDADGTA